MRESEYLDGSMKLINKLRGIPTLSVFTKEDLQVLIRFSKLRSYESGELIIKEGSYDCWLYFIISGSVKVVNQGVDIAVMENLGDIFGEMGIVSETARSASVFAMEEAVCLAANASDVENLTGRDKQAFGYVLYRLFAQILADRLSALIRKFDDIFLPGRLSCIS
ncbi:MAG TPA: cyclic nucleotide-binding domain-containing protein [Deltaproteobacteria bacterium]|nr:cyclic nucleotide-binding domain-containing protein [Deltaproteobacteria bacterium]